MRRAALIFLVLAFAGLAGCHRSQPSHYYVNQGEGDSGHTQRVRVENPYNWLAGHHVQELQSKDPNERMAACHGLAELYEPTCVPALIEVLHDPEPRVKRMAHEVLKFLTYEKLPPDYPAWLAWWKEREKRWPDQAFQERREALYKQLADPFKPPPPMQADEELRPAQEPER